VAAVAGTAVVEAMVAAVAGTAVVEAMAAAGTAVPAGAFLAVRLPVQQSQARQALTIIRTPPITRTAIHTRTMVAGMVRITPIRTGTSALTQMIDSQGGLDFAGPADLPVEQPTKFELVLKQNASGLGGINQNMAERPRLTARLVRRVRAAGLLPCRHARRSQVPSLGGSWLSRPSQQSHRCRAPTLRLRAPVWASDMRHSRPRRAARNPRPRRGSAAMLRQPGVVRRPHGAWQHSSCVSFLAVRVAPAAVLTWVNARRAGDAFQWLIQKLWRER